MPARVTVVGGGVIALLTAVECVLDGHRVTVVDQGPVPDGGATSPGRRRILRALRPADPRTTGAALRAQHRWVELEELLLTRFYERVGALTVLPPAAAADGAALVAAAGGTARELTAAGLSDRYPHLHLDGALGAVLEEEAGVLFAGRVLAACAGWLKWQRGVELVEHRAVSAVDGGSGTVRLADGRELHGDAVLVAVDPRSRNLLPEGVAERLTLYRQSLLHCRVPPHHARAWAATPAIASLGTPGGARLVPPVAGRGLKLTSAAARRVVDEVTDHATDPYWQRTLEREFGDVLPGFGPAWVTAAEDAYYATFAPAGGPPLAALGGAGYAYAACGGTSVEFAPLIARSLADRLAGSSPTPTGVGALDGPPPAGHAPPLAGLPAGGRM
ncbi:MULTISPECIES: FAD-binding oxidoreductase [unclassified Streptomyces]|uniref:NAD(P)/FAD-dependent oxidoreductase n=1 Tax=unclassified Streptomyces TaxID=2593676 RepID=UPI0004C87EE0|nr:MULTISPECIES: FAD-binding oxidoreductase [unclassified Streptomyces]KJY23623.1 FAD-dependent oxidoreductase [Streptomyces sp. NRRL S-104]